MRRLLATAVLLAGAAPAFAQNTASVPAADVVRGERALEYRAAYGVNDAGGEDLFQHRVIYHHSFYDSLKLLAFIQQGESGSRGLHAQRASVNFFTQLVESEESGGWDFALRFQGDIPLEDGRPGRARFGVINSFEFAERGQFRSNIYFAREIGDLAADGLVFDMREEATWKLSDQIRIGAQAFHALNTTAHIGGFDEQRHQIGPVLRWKATKELRIEASALFGASRAATDADLRIFASYGF
ncbi:MAG: hypothetical protein ACOZAA_01960 [Pseudomonadota bacterium]